MPSDRPALRVVLVNYRCADLIERHLASGVLRPTDEVVIVDNASDPERVAAWKSRYGITPVLLGTNRGFAAGVNAAVAASTHRGLPVLLLNPDVEVTADVLATLADALTLTSLDGVAGVGPLLRGIDGRLQVGTAGGPLSARSVATYFLFLSQIVPRARGLFLTRRQLARGGDVDWLCMACLLLCPDAFDRYGPVPEDELVYGEDLAWGVTATNQGARFVLVSEVTVVHQQGFSGGSAAWSGALERLLHRRLGSAAAAFAVGAFRIGTTARRALGRRIPGKTG